jgi:glucan 1,3-beta-glucosidase
MALMPCSDVRIPIGYWAFETSAGEPYVRADQLDYLRKGVGW